MWNFNRILAIILMVTSFFAVDGDNYGRANFLLLLGIFNWIIYAIGELTNCIEKNKN